ncbi:MAG: hypothetical protein GY859_27535, partial [Desulfobacterales bacterium]|nr:hypothetical protein [Desulfobacterales bacterium]
PDDDFSPRIDSNIKAFIEKTPDLDTVKYNAAVLFHGVLNEDEVKALEQSGEILVWDSPSAAFP